MLFVAGPTVGHAIPVLIDSNDAAAAPSFGGKWNTIPNTSGTTQLVDATGATTNITLSFSSNWVNDDYRSVPGLTDTWRGSMAMRRWIT